VEIRLKNHTTGTSEVVGEREGRTPPQPGRGDFLWLVNMSCNQCDKILC